MSCLLFMKGLVIGGFILLAILHQDTWNWDKADLVFGFLPVGLAYHAAYSVVVALFWAFVVKVNWPTWLEAWSDEES